MHLFSFETSVDLFASRLSNQLRHYVVYYPNPDALHVNASTIPWKNLYGFRPFATLGKVLQKVISDKWLSEPWYSLLLKLSIDVPEFVNSSKDLLINPLKNQVHPLSNKMNLLACLIPGKIPSQEFFDRKC